MSRFTNISEKLEDYFKDRIFLEWKEVHELFIQLRESVSQDIPPEAISIYEIMNIPMKSKRFKSQKKSQEIRVIKKSIANSKKELDTLIKELESKIEEINDSTTSNHKESLSNFFFESRPWSSRNLRRRYKNQKEISHEKETVDLLRNCSQIKDSDGSIKNHLGEDFDDQGLKLQCILCSICREKNLDHETISHVVSFFRNCIDPILIVEENIDKMQVVLSEASRQKLLLERPKARKKEYYENHEYFTNEEKILYEQYSDVILEYSNRLEKLRILEEAFRAPGNALRKQGVKKVFKGSNMKRINWSPLEEYGTGGKTTDLHSLFPLFKNIFGEELDWQRVMSIEELKPSSVYIGNNDFRGYICFIFESANLAVLEKPIYGNATYILPKNNWKELSKLTRTTLLKEYPEVNRCIHYDLDSWIASVKQFVVVQ